MPQPRPWKFASNTFLILTKGRLPLMGEILIDHAPKLNIAATTWTDLATCNTETQTLLGEWATLELQVINAEALQLSSTLAFESKRDSLTKKPATDINSPFEDWDTIIRAAVPFEGTVYTFLLPQGRATLTAGSNIQQIDAMKAFAERLGLQASKPTLLALSGTVTTFHTALKNLWDVQQAAIDAHTAKRAEIEAKRKAAAKQLFRNTGFAMTIWNDEDDLPKIEALFDMALLRDTEEDLPDAPGLGVWVPAARTLTAPAMPARGTRLELWRLGPGGAPELLVIGEKDALTVTIPADYTFDSGKLYQLYFKARNGRGSSEAGPAVSWTAP